MSRNELFCEGLVGSATLRVVLVLNVIIVLEATPSDEFIVHLFCHKMLQMITLVYTICRPKRNAVNSVRHNEHIVQICN